MTSGERMGGVDERADPLVPEPVGQPVGAAEAADPDLSGGQPGRPDPASQRRHHVHRRHVRQRRGQPLRLAGPAEQQHPQRPPVQGVS